MSIISRLLAIFTKQMENNLDRVLLVKDINAGEFGYPHSSSPSNMIEFAGKLYFAVNDGENGRELWVSDGTSAGTQLLTDINPDQNYGYSYGSAPESLVKYRDKLYFAANDGENGRELWVSDGTSAGTQLLADINPLRLRGLGYDSSVAEFTEFKDQLYFVANDGENGRELWVSDGTSGGTQLLADINSGHNNYDYPHSSSPGYFTEFENKLYFAASNAKTGRELWVSDGTSAGTQLLADINSNIGEDTYAESSSPSYFTEFEDKLYFAADDGETGKELWVSDGTSAGTQLFADINPDGSSEPAYLKEFADKLYFAADDGETGKELWVSDGTSAGTQLLADINPDGSSYPRYFTEFEDKLYFAADDGENGRELWVSDGTSAGTQLFADINPGAEGSEIFGGFTALNDELYFGADNGQTGTELFKLTLDNTDTAILGTKDADNLSGSDRADRIEALEGKDLIQGKAGDDTILGGEGQDVLQGNAGNDELKGEAGKDRLFGDSGRDLLFGGEGDDYLEGGSDKDTLDGNEGNDFILGGAGNDLLRGSEGNDFLYGNGGNDILVGGGDNDILLGGKGRDTFAIELDSGRSVVIDFVDGGDRLGLSDNLTFDDLQIVQNTTETLEDIHGDVLLGVRGRNINAEDTLIKDNGGELVAVLLNVDAATITSDDFTEL